MGANLEENLTPTGQITTQSGHPPGKGQVPPRRVGQAGPMTLRAYRRIALVAFGSLYAIIVTGALVRLTGSGLGCVDWPACNESRFIDVSSGHAAIEQLNRLFTGVVAASVIAAVLAGLRVRPRVPGLVPIALVLVAGVLAQVVIGGVVVLTGLNPWSNALHYLVSVALMTGAWALLRRVGGGPRGGAGPWSSLSARWPMLVLGAAAIVAGTVVTGAGPHAGDERAVRIGVAIRDATRVHGALVWLTLAAALVVIWAGRRRAEVRRAGSLLVVVGASQTAIGYAQYALGLPVPLVALHVAGSIAAWLAILGLWAAAGPGGPTRSVGDASRVVD